MLRIFWHQYGKWEMCYAEREVLPLFHRKRKVVGSFQVNKNHTWQMETSWRPWWQRRKGRLINKIGDIYVVILIGHKFLITHYYIPSFMRASIQSYIAVWFCNQTNLKKGSCPSLLIFIDQSVHFTCSMWISL